jgi:hypothetical protein
MEHFPGCLNRQESEAMAARLTAHFEKHGFGMWSVEAPGLAEFIGLVGLTAPRFEAPLRHVLRSGGGWPRTTGATATPAKPRASPYSTDSTSSA